MKGQSKSKFMPYEDERIVAKSKVTPKPKTLLPAPFKNEREMADSIAKQLGFVSPKTKVSPTPKPNIKAAEAALQKMIKAGKVKDLEKARQKIKEKYGVRPNGMTN